MNFNQNIVINIRNTWEETLGKEIPYHIIEKSFKNIRHIKEGSFIKYLQFKMLHKRIVTNKKLRDMGISDMSNCPYCGELEETIEHAFLYCETVKIFWNEVEQWLRLHIDTSIKLSNLEKIMGTDTTENIIDKTIIATDRVIYRNRQQGKPHSIREVKALLKSQMLLEEYHSSTEGTDTIFLKTWENIYRILY